MVSTVLAPSVLGYLPFHVRWDPAGVSPGAHLLSVMVGSYAGHLGSVSGKV